MKRYVYGYLNRIRSSGRLEAETHRNVEVIWLLRRLKVKQHTIEGPFAACKHFVVPTEHIRRHMRQDYPLRGKPRKIVTKTCEIEMVRDTPFKGICFGNQNIGIMACLDQSIDPFCIASIRDGTVFALKPKRH